ncbi:hypothetical protein SAMN05216223_109118 [Actinacidiphila yanglinensis]|uniref:Uncharacterized protein n=1 Tax=Actinacidiphila yanglinensis TaxID=310779 RepID=A0A1H6CKK4_9ACTN|nr:hypothetical protein [Actinacidiphila yanglinensis]SEG73472.1 hypothetical protein SAMN05216223_109118 [Actinacidiphila yanglinensis]
MLEIDVTLAAGRRGSAEDDLRSLLRWLREDENLAGRADGRVRDGTPPQPGRMGTAFDILQLVIGSGLSAAALVVSVLQWRDARHREPAITLRRGGMTVEIPSASEVNAAVLTRAVELLAAVPVDAVPAEASAEAAPAEGPLAGEPVMVPAAAAPPPPAPPLPLVPLARTPPPSVPPLPSAPLPVPPAAAHAPAPLTEEPEGDGTPS